MVLPISLLVIMCGGKKEDVYTLEMSKGESRPLVHSSSPVQWSSPANSDTPVFLLLFVVHVVVPWSRQNF